MIKCMGICSKCGRCDNAALMSSSDKRKAGSMHLPEDFVSDKGGSGYGVAFDVGTTTVVGMLWNLETGEHVKSIARANPQAQYGADVISRITYCGHEGENVHVLRRCITECMNEIIELLKKEHPFNNNEINRVCVCGNTTMSHLFAGYPVMSLALAPFTPAYEGRLDMSGQESGLHINDGGVVTVIPNIAGHVGGDIVAGMVATRLTEASGVTLYIDIGTNGEIVLVDGDEVYACSTAAGPAFEGASIECGMRAADGAIEKVLIDGDNVFFRTIGGCEAVGICGSGIIDAAAQMVTSGMVNKKGRMTADNKELVLAESESGEKIVITQKDIREIQLAKGAVSAGITILLKEADRRVEEIDKIIIAGAFGSYIDKHSAVKIGLLPDVNEDIIVSVGNAAGAGVSMAMMSSEEMGMATKMPRCVKHIELADREDFMDIYMNCLLF